MEDRETPRMRKYGESKTTRIIMATVPHVTAWAGRTKYQVYGFLIYWVYNSLVQKLFHTQHGARVNLCSGTFMKFMAEKQTLHSFCLAMQL